MEEKNKQYDQQYIEKLEKHIDNTKSNIKYSVDRFDILIISICSGGLVLSLNFLKDIDKDSIINLKSLIVLTWVAFGSSIITNLISQITSFFGNKLELEITKIIIKKEKQTLKIDNQNKLELRKNKYNSATYWCNSLSLLLLITGVILLLVFMSNNIK